VIRSWRNAASRKVWQGEQPNRFPGLDFDAAIDLLLALNVAKALQDLSPLKSVGLHKLKGDRKWPMGHDRERTLADLLRVPRRGRLRCRDRRLSLEIEPCLR
jgi:hypothetical protein